MLIKLCFFFLFSTNIYAVVLESNSGLFAASKSYSELFRDNNIFITRFLLQNSVKTSVGEFGFSSRMFKNYALTATFHSNLNKGSDIHALECFLSRGFTDTNTFGSLSLGYRLGKFYKKEQWIMISSSAGYIPKPWGVETEIIYYFSLTSERYGRIRFNVNPVYRILPFDLGFKTSIYAIPKGELGTPDVTGIDKSNAIIEEFIQLEGGVFFSYHLKSAFIFSMILSNVFFINQKNYSESNARKQGIKLDYAPKVFLSLSFKF